MTDTVTLRDNSIKFPYTYLCKKCNTTHAAILFSSNMLSYLQYHLSENIDVFEYIVKDPSRSRKTKENALCQLEMLTILLKKVSDFSNTSSDNNNGDNDEIDYCCS